MTVNVPLEDTADFKDIDQAIEENYPLFSAMLGELCAQPSVSSLQNNYKALDDTARLIASLLEEREFSGKALPSTGHPLLFAALGNNPSKPTLLSFNSYELQAAEEMDEWQKTMFGLTEREGLLYGRGIADNKANFVARLAAIEIWRAVRGDLPVNVKFLIEGRVPNQHSDLTFTLVKHARELKAEACLWDTGEASSDGRLVLGLGIKGILAVELESRTINQSASSALGGVFPSAAWRLTWALTAIKTEQEDIQIEGFENSINVPTVEDSRFLRKALPQYNERLRERLELYTQPHYLLELDGLPLIITEFFTPTANVNFIEAGNAQYSSNPELVNVAKARLDFRLVPDQDPDEIYNLLTEHLQKKGFEDIEVRKIGVSEKPARTPIGHPFVQKTIESAEQATGLSPVVIPLAAGAGSLPQFKAALQDIPVVICGTDYAGSQRNTPSEHIRKSDFINHIKMVTRLISRYQDQFVF
jgi:acetylornithine deacetylase/succinyl-diaminopimelate desuccinylase-like protein